MPGELPAYPITRDEMYLAAIVEELRALHKELRRERPKPKPRLKKKAAADEDLWEEGE